MVFQPEGHFQPFLHCKFKENIVSVLFLPRTVDSGAVFLVVNKWGKIGLYSPETMGLVHTFCLNLLPSFSPMSSNPFRPRPEPLEPPKCQRSHLIVDAIYAHDFNAVLFATTKSLLQCYDIGEIEEQNLGLDILPRKEFRSLRLGKSPLQLKNKGFVETHRILNLDSVPSCLHYCPLIPKPDKDKTVSLTKEKKVTIMTPERSFMAKILIGDVDGGVTIILISNLKTPFGRRKIRGCLAKINFQELRATGHATSYKAHNDPVRQIQYLGSRHQILSCSRDKKFSLFCEDFTEISDSFIISLPKGVNAIAYSESLKLIATGSEDAIVRFFSQFSMRMPQMELNGHKASIIALEMLQVPFSESPLLISFSEDVEIRAWDPLTYTCLQSLYLRFPPGSTIMCKTPEFAKRCVFIHQPHFRPKLNKSTTKTQSETTPTIPEDAEEKPSKTTVPEVSKADSKNDGFILLLYCNAYATLRIERDKSHWPFDFEEFLSEITTKTGSSRKYSADLMRKRDQSNYKDPKSIKLTEEEKSDILMRSRDIQKELMRVKTHLDDRYSAGFRSNSKDTLASKGAKMFCTVDHSELPFRERMLQRNASVFKYLPLYEVPDKIRPENKL